MVIGCITESQKLINDAVESEEKGGSVNMCKALENRGRVVRADRVDYKDK